MIINPQLKNPKFYLMIFMDIFIFIVALCLSYLLRFEFSFAHIDIEQIYRLASLDCSTEIYYLPFVRALRRHVALHQRAGFLAVGPGLSLIDGTRYGDYPDHQQI